jgi:hypothetical protein
MMLPRDDVAFADGKMDTGKAQKWIKEADDLLSSAEVAFASGHYGQALAYAEAARTLAGTIDMLVAQTLGMDKLPPHELRPVSGWAPWPVRQPGQPGCEQVRQDLLQTHDDIVRHGYLPMAKAADNYLVQALSAYKTAYDAYRDGNYVAASDANWLAQGLLRVADNIVTAIDATNAAPGRFPPEVEELCDF